MDPARIFDMDQSDGNFGCGMTHAAADRRDHAQSLLAALKPALLEC